MRLQHEGNPYPRSDSWKRTSQNGTRENKGSKRTENTDEDQRCRKFPRICQFLLMIHLQLQSYRKTIKRTERKKEMKIGKGIFEELKEKITSQPVLALPRREGKFRVEMDASGHAIEGVLSQEQEGKWKPIAFLSRTMQPAEQNYEIYDKKLLAIVEALTKWRQYLLDAVETFEIWTDHENLKYFREPHKLNG